MLPNQNVVGDSHDGYPTNRTNTYLCLYLDTHVYNSSYNNNIVDRCAVANARHTSYLIILKVILYSMKFSCCS